MSGPMQWTPKGMVSVRASAAGTSHVAAVRRADGAEDADDAGEVAPVQTRPTRAPTRLPAAKTTTPKDVVRMARARLREVRTELRRMKRLEKERDELERLVTAAENKPRAIVRELPKRSTG